MNGFFGIDLATYNIYNELGFLLLPTMRAVVKPALRKYLSGMSDAEIKELAMSYAEALRQQASQNGYVNVFGVQLGADAFDGLHDILTRKL